MRFTLTLENVECWGDVQAHLLAVERRVNFLGNELHPAKFEPRSETVTDNSDDGEWSIE